jgi:hypothetical protein
MVSFILLLLVALARHAAAVMHLNEGRFDLSRLVVLLVGTGTLVILLSWCVYHSFLVASHLFLLPLFVPPVSSVTNMDSMFEEASSFNSDLSSWDGKPYTIVACCCLGLSFCYCEHHMEGRFDLSCLILLAATGIIVMLVWCDYHSLVASHLFLLALFVPPVAKMTSMYKMFSGADYFNIDISSWDGKPYTVVTCCLVFTFCYCEHLRKNYSIDLVSSSCLLVLVSSSCYIMVVYHALLVASHLFLLPLFVPPVARVTKMASMFYYAKRFDQDISKWDGKLFTAVACCLDFAAAVSIIRKDDSIDLVSSWLLVLV